MLLWMSAYRSLCWCVFSFLWDPDSVVVPGVFPGPGPTLPGSRLVSCQPLGPLGMEKTVKSQFTGGVSMKFPRWVLHEVPRALPSLVHGHGPWGGSLGAGEGDKSRLGRPSPCRVGNALSPAQTRYAAPGHTLWRSTAWNHFLTVHFPGAVYGPQRIILTPSGPQIWTLSGANTCVLTRFGADIPTWKLLFSRSFDPMDCSMPSFPVLHHLLELTQTHVHWVSDAIQPSSVVVPFSCPQSFPASGSFPISQLLASGGPSIGASASASVLPVNIQDWFPLELTGLMIVTFCKEQRSLERQLLRTDNDTTGRAHTALSQSEAVASELNFSRCCRPTVWSALCNDPWARDSCPNSTDKRWKLRGDGELSKATQWLS